MGVGVGVGVGVVLFVSLLLLFFLLSNPLLSITILRGASIWS